MTAFKVGDRVQLKDRDPDYGYAPGTYWIVHEVISPELFTLRWPDERLAQELMAVGKVTHPQQQSSYELFTEL